ncbi:MAG TPA: MmcQ/YjbR family DNA-binding protein [Burkholderiaceae bacterium]|nr:MmcQ/YjbR family DNA-binding protein [Burkholderiaceae bacterium]
MTAEHFRKLALAFPESVESAHVGHPDFRVRKRVFATLAYPDATFGMVKLTPAQQKHFVDRYPTVFVPVKGGWGERGSTNVKLRHATRATLMPALAAAWRDVAPLSLVAADPGD